MRFWEGVWSVGAAIPIVEDHTRCEPVGSPELLFPIQSLQTSGAGEHPPVAVRVGLPLMLMSAEWHTSYTSLNL